MIIKIQLSTGSTDGKRHLLVNDESRSFQYQEEATREMMVLMGKKLKKYFAARIVDGKLEILEEVVDQDW